MGILNTSQINLGWTAANFMLNDAEGNTYLLNDFKDKKGTVVVFTCNHCPHAKVHWPLFNELYEKFQSEINFVAINPNDEIESPEDSLEKMPEYIKTYNIKFPYLRDASQEIATKYEAQCTPDTFLFKTINNELELFYRGKVVDFPHTPEKITKRYLENAILDLLADKKPPVEQPVAVGCSIKWK